eukprot:3311950-Pyramimonas_sp.AAC.1
MSLGPSAPGFFPIQDQEDHRGSQYFLDECWAEVCSVPCLGNEASDESCTWMKDLVGHSVHPWGAPAGCKDGGQKLGPPGSGSAGNVYSGMPMEEVVEEPASRAWQGGGGVPYRTATVPQCVVKLVGPVMPCAVVTPYA